MINLDQRGEVVSELWARVARDADGRPRLEAAPGQQARWNAVLLRHADKGPIRLTLTRLSQRRSSQQNRYYHGVVLQDVFFGLKERAEEHGLQNPFEDVEELHWWFKREFLSKKGILHSGEEITKLGSSARLTIEQFTVYIEQISAWAAERGVYVRHANEEFDERQAQAI